MSSRRPGRRLDLDVPSTLVEIAERMGVSATNVSFHLKELERSGLISQRRESRSIIYSASYESLADLVKFLMEDCCAGHPAIRENVEKSEGCCSPAGEVAGA